MRQKDVIRRDKEMEVYLRRRYPRLANFPVTRWLSIEDANEGYLTSPLAGGGKVVFADGIYAVMPGESPLEAMLRHGIDTVLYYITREGEDTSVLSLYRVSPDGIYKLLRKVGMYIPLFSVGPRCDTCDYHNELSGGWVYFRR